MKPVRGWRVRAKAPTKLRTNLYQIATYATDAKRQGSVDFGGAMAFGVFYQPWDRFLSSGAPSLWPTAITRPCLSCGKLVSGTRKTCDQACRQRAYRVRKAAELEPSRDTSRVSPNAVTPAAVCPPTVTATCDDDDRARQRALFGAPPGRREVGPEVTHAPCTDLDTLDGHDRSTPQ